MPDPNAPLRAAALFGRLAAQGLLDEAEIHAVLTRVRAPGRDPAGLRMRLLHAYADSAAHWQSRRRRAAWRIRAALSPLLDAWAPAAAILRVAQQAADDSLLPGEPAAIAAGAAAERLRPGRRA